MSGIEPAPMPRLNSTPPGITLGALDLVPRSGGRNFVVQFSAGRFHGFVVRRERDVFGYVDRCPHMGLPLAQELDRYLTDDAMLIACSWHGALFEPDTGRCVAGPCRGSRLTEWPVHVRDGFIVTGPPGGPVDAITPGPA
jgi:nitrite reductase/ring-hydroxylating ferredoxin subunit